ncbi:hypothetical protein HPB50_012962 [Hyalomma asiaticum]|uniref:Uncharacterized protein n=1 Tax=Hyalomma asiaticum TaxID=266040 RepID=A0ACB7RTR6_HYAAI|nr:hypothetical protein HPB50_012962 [Hyalomma asiaticum]
MYQRHRRLHFAVFEPGCDNEEYRKIHNEYKNLGEPQGTTDDAEKADEKNSKDDEEALMAHVMKKSLEEEATAKEQETMEEKLIQEAIQATLLEKQRLEAESSKEKELLDKALKLSLAESPPPQAESEETVPKETPSAEAPSEQQNAAIEDDELAWRHRATTEEVNQRREYLRNQRDKLVALKRAEREKQLNNTLERDEPQRPRSARAARAALGGTVTLEAPNVADQGNLAFRKSLAARLKAEIHRDLVLPCPWQLQIYEVFQKRLTTLIAQAITPA